MARNRAGPNELEAANLVQTLARAVQAAHSRSVVHRDLKPGNVLLAGDGTPKMTDFGLARKLDEPIRTQSGAILGTPNYMPPEQARGKVRELGPAVDVYALGAILYECLTGRPPSQGATPVDTVLQVIADDPRPPREQRPDVPRDLEAVCLKCLQKTPSLRYPTAQALADDLARCVSGKPAVPEPGAPPEQPPLNRRVDPPRTPRLSRRGLLLGGGAAAVIAGAGGPGVWLTRRPEARAPGEVVPGMSGPFTGPTREPGRSMEVGLQTCFRKVNDDGGVHGRTLRLVTLDDGYKPEQAAVNMRRLLDEYGAFAFIGNVGTPTAEVALPIALGSKRVFFGAYTGARLLRKDQPSRYVFNFRASEEQETAQIVDYLVERVKLPADSVAVLAQNDGYGESGFQGVARALRKYGRPSWGILKVEYDRGERRGRGGRRNREGEGEGAGGGDGGDVQAGGAVHQAGEGRGAGDGVHERVVRGQPGAGGGAARAGGEVRRGG
jgi:hypothetical protein